MLKICFDIFVTRAASKIKLRRSKICIIWHLVYRPYSAVRYLYDVSSSCFDVRKMSQEWTPHQHVLPGTCHAPLNTTRHPPPSNQQKANTRPAQSTIMSNPVVFFDITIGGAMAGRIEMTVRFFFYSSSRERESSRQLQSGVTINSSRPHPSPFLPAIS